jgi:hypothetical protein
MAKDLSQTSNLPATRLLDRKAFFLSGDWAGKLTPEKDLTLLQKCIISALGVVRSICLD